MRPIKTPFVELQKARKRLEAFRDSEAFKRFLDEVAKIEKELKKLEKGKND